MLRLKIGRKGGKESKKLKKGYPMRSTMYLGSYTSMSLRPMLEKHPIQSSAPCRINCGGTWDIKTLALPYSKITPVTVNMALTSRVTVTLLPYEDERVKVTSEGFESEECLLDSAPFDSPLGLLFAVAVHFQFHGVHMVVKTDAPPSSGLGGSGATTVATVHALSKAAANLGGKLLSRKATALLAYAIEDALGISPTGLQDQLAATFGGVNKWSWIYRPSGKQYERETLVRRKDCAGLQNHILVAYTGESHSSRVINNEWLQGFIEGSTRREWMEIHDTTQKFADALKRFDWKQAAQALDREMEIRCMLTPQVLTADAKKLVNAARTQNCGVRVAGAGGGGCVWAIGASGDIARLRRKWHPMLERMRGKLLECKIDHRGVH